LIRHLKKNDPPLSLLIPLSERGNDAPVEFILLRMLGDDRTEGRLDILNHFLNQMPPDRAEILSWLFLDDFDDAVSALAAKWLVDHCMEDPDAATALRQRHLVVRHMPERFKLTLEALSVQAATFSQDDPNAGANALITHETTQEDYDRMLDEHLQLLYDVMDESGENINKIEQFYEIGEPIFPAIIRRLETERDTLLVGNLLITAYRSKGNKDEIWELARKLAKKAFEAIIESEDRDTVELNRALLGDYLTYGISKSFQKSDIEFLFEVLTSENTRMPSSSAFLILIKNIEGEHKKEIMDAIDKHKEKINPLHLAGLMNPKEYWCRPPASGLVQNAAAPESAPERTIFEKAEVDPPLSEDGNGGEKPEEPPSPYSHPLSRRSGRHSIWARRAATAEPMTIPTSAASHAGAAIPCACACIAGRL
jgi:hypothetical protein